MNPLKMLSRGGAVSEPSDADFENVTLLLHGDGTNGAQNNTFLDSSTNNFTITRNGNTTQGTFSPFSKVDGRWGNYFDGTDDYLSVADNAVLRPGAGAFTLEAWIYRNAAGAAHTIYAKGGASTGISFLVTSGNVLRFTHTTTNIDSSGTVAANAWVHVAVVREGTGTNQTKLYINGTQDGQGTVSTDFTQTEEVRIGTNRSAGDDFAGYISNVRFVKGSALYTGNFTPSTSPFTTTSQGASSSEVELLTCQSNRFVDNSTNAFAITRNGDVRVTPFSPFAPTAAYDPAVNGGSGYFDGTGDFLEVPDNAAFELGSGDFTIESWFYPTNLSAGNTILAKWELTQQGFIVQVLASGTAVRLAYTTNGSISVIRDYSATITTNQWYHIAICRSSGDTKAFLNGAQIGSTTSDNVTFYDGTSNINVGKNQQGTTTLAFGYLSDVRVVKGTAVYTAAFTPPTAPLTAISNTSFLLNFTNAGIIDNSMSNNLETVGNAQIDTTTKKYGTGSMEFDGSGDYLSMPYTPEQDLGTGNFTIEMWAYWSSLSSTTGLFNKTRNPSGNDWQGIHSFVSTSGTINFETNDTLSSGTTGARISSSSNVSTGQWYHIAFVRSSGTTTIYLNGTSVGSGSNTGSCDGTFGTEVGIARRGTTWSMNGFIDDFRITKGKARYTSNFTPPTAAFEDIGE